MTLQKFEEIVFFEAKPQEASLYHALLKQMNETLLPFERRVQKTQITFVNPRVFACVSLRWKGCILITFGLPFKAESPRIQQATEVYPGRWTLHVKVRSLEEIDSELLNWLEAAYAFAARK